ncbi:SDR family NAD(P)-dependent oxidoreductase [Nocardiopsis sp. MG754419]|uniref:SDR family NAD(P)-dependent oxidoreductase n=1 Tax=Nocardiopsis sp. MG754419 TaxID=2259865 RepID=UPI001BA86B44|nr:SDR family oxidoreductase [Nocardiopsis sp. MG754419]MBR8743449.1 3-ketoacyl-ACP reductase [Nocardiopsis sp. MG754419]
MDLGLRGARVLVTGASRGIGRSIAEVFAEEGADLALCARDGAALKVEADALTERHGVRVVARGADVSVPEELAAFVAASARELGGLDVVVSNVSGGGAPTPEQWRRGFESDLMPFVGLVEEAGPHLEASSRAAVVLISSTSALHVTAPSGAKAYGPMKAAMNHYASALAHEWAPRGVRVNTVSPGPTEFPGGGWAIRRDREPEYYAAIRSRIPVGRMGRPEEIARAVAFVASPSAGFVIGANLLVDGGFLDRIR